jgi:hypothetical protein
VKHVTDSAGFAGAPVWTERAQRLRNSLSIQGLNIAESGVQEMKKAPEVGALGETRSRCNLSQRGGKVKEFPDFF